MDLYKVDLFLLQNRRYFSERDWPVIRSILFRVDDSRWDSLLVMRLKDPTLALVFSFFLGTLGIDRFYVGNVGLGLLKLLTAGLGGLWTFIDWFLIMRAARNANCRALERYVE